MDDDESNDGIVWFPALVADLSVPPPAPPQVLPVPRVRIREKRKQWTTVSTATMGTLKTTRYHLRNCSSQETQVSTIWFLSVSHFRRMRLIETCQLSRSSRGTSVRPIPSAPLGLAGAVQTEWGQWGNDPPRGSVARWSERRSIVSLW